MQRPVGLLVNVDELAEDADDPVAGVQRDRADLDADPLAVLLTSTTSASVTLAVPAIFEANTCARGASPGRAHGGELPSGDVAHDPLSCGVDPADDPVGVDDVGGYVDCPRARARRPRRSQVAPTRCQSPRNAAGRSSPRKGDASDLSASRAGLRRATVPRGDLVSSLRGWRAPRPPESRSSLRTIADSTATNACLSCTRRLYRSSGVGEGADCTPRESRSRPPGA